MTERELKSKQQRRMEMGERIRSRPIAKRTFIRRRVVRIWGRRGEEIVLQWVSGGRVIAERTLRLTRKRRMVLK